jgi:uncharacterized repeat protein (TIGR03803 family)
MKPFFVAIISCLLPTFLTLRAQTNYQQLWAFDGSSGAAPTTPLIEGSDDNLYGIGGGTVFKLNKHGGGCSVTYHFSGSAGYGLQGMVQGAGGVLYGISGGSVFRLNPNGSGYRVLHNFGANSIDGTYPESQLVVVDQKLYGTTQGGGNSDFGTVFTLGTDGGGYTILHSFAVADLKIPQGGLVKATNGVLYGMTVYGVSNNLAGGIFKINPDGSGYAALHSFQTTGRDASSPCFGMVQGSDGNLYGTTAGGGSNDFGTVFRINLDGSDYRVIRSFRPEDGSSPQRLIDGADGALYGVDSDGGSHFEGAVFKLNKDGSGFTTLYSFSLLNGDGFWPTTPLLQASDGALYGATSDGGIRDTNNPLGYGTVFRLFSGAPQISITHLEFDGGGARLSLSGGAAGQSYNLQASTNLTVGEDWQTIGSATAALNGSFQFLDTYASNYAARFYRSATP